MSALVLVASCAKVDGTSFTKSDLDSYVAAFVSVGCQVSFDNHTKVEDITGFSEKKLKAITKHFKAKGVIVQHDDKIGIRLKHKDCPNG